MSYREVPFAFREFYHIYNRGNSKRKIFLDFADYKRFQDLLYLANTTEPVTMRSARRGGVYEVKLETSLVAIGAYCLMPNHFHILLTPLVDDGVSIFMKKVTTGYSMYFNKRYEHTGSLFEGRFKSEHASRDEYLKYLFSYIHLNPLKIKHVDWKVRVAHELELLKQAEAYAFSSYQDYVHGKRNESMILSKEHFPKYFSDRTQWEKEMGVWITYQTEI